MAQDHDQQPIGHFAPWPALETTYDSADPYTSDADWLLHAADFVPDTLEQESAHQQSSPAELTGQTDRLEVRTGEIIDGLSKTHYALPTCGFATEKAAFNWELARSVFTIHNLQLFIRAYFRHAHQYNPVIYPPAFDCEKASARLLLSVFLFGSMVSAPCDSTLAARCFFDLAEEYIFSHIIFSPTYEWALQGERHQGSSVADMEVLQAAQVIQVLQITRNDTKTRRRIRIDRHPRLVTALRLSGLLCNKLNSQASNWENYIRHETGVRLATWSFVNDAYLATFFNNVPQIMPSELLSDLPRHGDLFEPETALDFERLRPLDIQRLQPPSVSGFILSLFQDTWPGPQDDLYSSVTSTHLLILVFGELSSPLAPWS
ncbi:Transcription factor fungi [Macrophomina phaseolina MS6]|uniref:Transcription factor fungi n=1 Tax=Macrophomina phaseolina (strain MS6) TaxID=1126212 RepID=K2S9L3_MACPH|nr:Transcription factor fungi [Macrophomina phaseolina MS6]